MKCLHSLEPVLQTVIMLVRVNPSKSRARCEHAHEHSHASPTAFSRPYPVPKPNSDEKPRFGTRLYGQSLQPSPPAVRLFLEENSPNEERRTQDQQRCVCSPFDITISCFMEESSFSPAYEEACVRLTGMLLLRMLLFCVVHVGRKERRKVR